MAGLLENFGQRYFYENSMGFSGYMARGRFVIHTPEAVRKQICKREQGFWFNQNVEK